MKPRGNQERIEIQLNSNTTKTVTKILGQKRGHCRRNNDEITQTVDLDKQTQLTGGCTSLPSSRGLHGNRKGKRFRAISTYDNNC